ncbi:MAG: T9SS type A sorting domain-containing protein [Candidatus Syntrophosphaera sp.]
MKKIVAVLIFFTLLIVGMSAYTLTIEAYDLNTNATLNAQIYRNGLFTGFLTPHDFVDAAFLPGDYSCQLECYGNWLPAYVTFNSTNNSVTFEFRAIYICGEVPVELSSFTATTMQENVQLQWVSQTELNMLGYRVYRNEENNQSNSLLITPEMIPATNTSSTQTYSIVDDEVEFDHTYYYWLESVDMGSHQFHGPVSVIVEGEVPPVLPEMSTVSNAYPNPFKANTNTTIEVTIKEGESGAISIYNVLGQVVKTYSVQSGTHNITWNGRDSRGNVCGSGIYFYKLSTPSMNQTKKLVIVK